jgi:hypothetical protein
MLRWECVLKLLWFRGIDGRVCAVRGYQSCGGGAQGALVPAAGGVAAWYNVGDDGAGVGGSVFAPIWLWLVVCCFGCVCFCSRICSYGGVCSGPLYTNVVSSYVT